MLMVVTIEKYVGTIVIVSLITILSSVHTVILNEGGYHSMRHRSMGRNNT